MCGSCVGGSEEKQNDRDWSAAAARDHSPMPVDVADSAAQLMESEAWLADAIVTFSAPNGYVDQPHPVQVLDLELNPAGHGVNCVLSDRRHSIGAVLSQPSIDAWRSEEGQSSWSRLNGTIILPLEYDVGINRERGQFFILVKSLEWVDSRPRPEGAPFKIGHPEPVMRDARVSEAFQDATSAACHSRPLAPRTCLPDNEAVLGTTARPAQAQALQAPSEQACGFAESARDRKSEASTVLPPAKAARISQAAPTVAPTPSATATSCLLRLERYATPMECASFPVEAAPPHNLVYSLLEIPCDQRRILDALMGLDQPNSASESPDRGRVDDDALQLAHSPDASIDEVASFNGHKSAARVSAALPHDPHCNPLGLQSASDSSAVAAVGSRSPGANATRTNSSDVMSGTGGAQARCSPHCDNQPCLELEGDAVQPGGSGMFVMQSQDPDALADLQPATQCHSAEHSTSHADEPADDHEEVDPGAVEYLGAQSESQLLVVSTEMPLTQPPLTQAPITQISLNPNAPSASVSGHSVDSSHSADSNANREMTFYGRPCQYEALSQAHEVAELSDAQAAKTSQQVEFRQSAIGDSNKDPNAVARAGMTHLQRGRSGSSPITVCPRCKSACGDVHVVLSNGLTFTAAGQPLPDVLQLWNIDVAELWQPITID